MRSRVLDSPLLPSAPTGLAGFSAQEEDEDDDYLDYVRSSSYALAHSPARATSLEELRKLKSSLLSPSDPRMMRQAIFDEVLRAASKHPGLSNQRYTLRLVDPRYLDNKEFSPEDEIKAVLGGGTLSWRLGGKWQLIDNATGKVIEEKEATIARVPYLTNRGTFVHNGSDYAVASQWRLRPAVFLRRRHTGEIESHVNVLPTDGVSHRIHLDPQSGVFKIAVRQGELPLYPLLKALGASDEEMESVLGKELLEANRQAARGQAASIYKRMRKALVLKSLDDDKLSDEEAIRKALSSARLDRLAVRKLLNLDQSTLSKDVYLAAVRRMLEASRSGGNEDFDDRDQLAFQRLYTPAQLLAERIIRDYGHMQQDLLRKVTREGSLKPIRAGALTRQLMDALVSSGLGNYLEETNATEVLDRRLRTTRLGEGGVGSVEAFPEETRTFHVGYAGFLDPVKTPETLRAGIDLPLASGVKVDRLGNVYAPFQDVRTGELTYLSPRQLTDKVITTSEELADPSRKVVRAISGNKIRYVPRSKVDLVIPFTDKISSPLANLVPMQGAVRGQRVSMGARMISQALPLKEPEAPLVQSLDEESGESYETIYGRALGSQVADADGTVIAVGKGGIKIRHDDGSVKTYSFYENFPLNRRTLWNHIPIVKPGDRVAKGQVIARSNFTDEKGTLALGRNFRVGYLAAKGLNFEDAIVISESAAKKLTSEHMHQHTLELHPRLQMGRSMYMGIFPKKYNRQQLENMDDDGVVKRGTIVNPGDPLILGAEKQFVPGQKQRGRRKHFWKDVSVVWDSDVAGEVVHVYKHPSQKIVNVVVRSYRPAEVGDKLSGRYGDKGVIAAIWPDDKMPQDESGQPLEILLNPLGINSRTNPAQIHETILGEIAHRRGKPYVMKPFTGGDEDLTDFVENEMRKYGVKDLQDVVDPETGNKIGKVLVGRRWMMRLHHLAEEKEQGRSVRGEYSVEELPAKGGDEGAMRLGLLNTFALLSHGAINFMRGSALVRGQRNEDFWLSLMAGNAPPPPRVPLIFRKFVASLRAGGVNVAAKGPKLNIMAMTADDVEKMTEGRVLSSAETLSFSKNMEPIAGGLFDVRLTGGPGGSRWSALKLSEPVLNPVMEEPIARLLDLTPAQLEEVIAGKRKLPDGRWGLRGIAEAISEVDLDAEIRKTRALVQSDSRSTRIAAIRKLRYLENMRKLGVHPKQYLWTKVPVLPPIFRPIAEMGGSKQMMLVADVNYLYKALAEADKNLSELRRAVGNEGTGEEQLHLYRTLKAVTGLGEPPQRELRQKQVRGILAHVFGQSAKHGYMQSRLLSSVVDLVGRGVIVPDSRIDMDSIYLPEDKAWKVYEPFVVRRLRRVGMPLSQALSEVKNRSEAARKALLDEMSDRPVVVDRHPVWHKFGMLAFYPKITQDKVIKVSPLIVKGFNADFDGDTMSFHVPVTDEELEEVKQRMLPSRNLLSPADFKSAVHIPTQEYVLGLYFGTRSPRKREGKIARRVFKSMKDLEAALERGDIKPWDNVAVVG